MNITEMREKSLDVANKAHAFLAGIEGDLSGEQEAEFDRMMAESDSLRARAEKVERAEARQRELAEIVTPVVADKVVVEGRSQTDAEKREAAFASYLRGNITGVELRAQGVGTAAEGGYLVPRSMSDKLILAMKAYGPLLEGGPAEYIVTDKGNPIDFASLDDTANIGAQLAENTAASDGDLVFGQKTLGAYKYTSKVFKVSNELLTDSAINVVDIVNAAMAERLGRALNAAFTTGNGTTAPQGVVTGASPGVTAALTTAIALDEFTNLEHSVDPAYRANAGYMFHDNILLAQRKVKDTTGRPLWQPSYTVGAADTFNDRPYWINNDMASAIAANAKTVLFGDFSKFTVRRVKDIVLRRLDERYAEADQVGFVAFVRVDSCVLDTRAIKVLTQAAS